MSKDNELFTHMFIVLLLKTVCLDHFSLIELFGAWVCKIFNSLYSLDIDPLSNV